MIKEIVFMGSQQAGCTGLLTLLASGHKVTGIITYENILDQLSRELAIPGFSSILQPQIIELLGKGDLLVSVHGKEIVPIELLSLPRLGCINVHPCLYAYKGANPIERLLNDGNTKASIGVHRMTEKVDEGEVIIEEFVDVTGKQYIEEVYNVLYPYYSLTLLKALQILEAYDG